MSSKKCIPETIRPLFQIEREESAFIEDVPEITDRKAEAKRVVKRLHAVIEDHQAASELLKVELGGMELQIILAGLRDHARGGDGRLQIEGYDEVQQHCLRRLFDELLEEPSNILYTTSTSQDTMRYDAMDPDFWIECLDNLEQSFN